MADPTSGLILDLSAADYYPASGNNWYARTGQTANLNGNTFDPGDVAFNLAYNGNVITVPGVSSSPTHLDHCTYEVWVKQTSYSTNSPTIPGWIVSQGPDYSWSRAITLDDTRTGYVSVTTGHTWNAGLDSKRPPVESWFHVVGVWDEGGNSFVYLNGERSPSVQGSTNNGQGNSAEYLVIGGITSGSGHGINGKVSDVRVYNRQLNRDEVRQLYRMGRRSAMGDLSTPNCPHCFLLIR